MGGTSVRKRLGLKPANAEQTARYTLDMLISLKRLAEINRQTRLALLIEQAAEEADTICQKRQF
ncbi:MAG: hypothetical protein ACT4OG_07100 [Alphaproteobacteria bacterium]